MPVNATTISLYRNEKSLPYNATITILCHRGFRFDDGYVSKSIRCTEEEKWNETISSCEGSKIYSITNILMLLMLSVLCFYAFSNQLSGKALMQIHRLQNPDVNRYLP